MGKKIPIVSILDRVGDNEFVKSLDEEWDFSSFEKFVVSFERLSEKRNTENSKRYGNIAKRIVKSILEEDIGGFDPHTGRKFTDKEIYFSVCANKSLLEKFEKLYWEIHKRNKWRIEMPYMSSKHDIMLDKYKNDIERYYVIKSFMFENKAVVAKDVKNKKKKKIKFDDLDNYEKNEIEKVFFKLLKRIKNRNGANRVFDKDKKLIKRIFDKFSSMEEQNGQCP